MSGVATAGSQVRAEVDLRRLVENLAVIEAAAGRPVDVIASIKANAYGHGAVPVATALAEHGVRGLATGSIDEATAVRASGIDTPILIFPGWLPDAAPTLVEQQLTPILDRIENARALSRAAAADSVGVWVKIDAGLGRHGVSLSDAGRFASDVHALPGTHVEGVMTHLPFVDRAGLEWATGQLRAFGECVEAVRVQLGHVESQALSSAGVLAGLPDVSSAICPGHAMYGIASASADVAELAELRPVLTTIRARLAHVARHASDRRAGVGGALTLAAGSTTGVASVGRSDGYRMAPGAPASMLVRDRRAPVLGLSLEHVLLDLTGVPDATVGDDVILLGRSGAEEIALTDLAAWQGLGSTDALLSFNGRIPFDYRT